MNYHVIFIFYTIFFAISTLGYGYIFSNIINKNFSNLNLGYQGLIGFFFITFISIITSFFIKHGYIHNFVLHSIGIIYFLAIFKKKVNFFELKSLFLVLVILIIGIYVFKNHDDFSYYHLTYSLNLSENKLLIGTGNFSHGFRTFSSIFYYNSILYMPYIKFYLFHISAFFILLYFNLILIFKIFDLSKKKNFNFIYFFSLLSFAFANIIFYRIGEHGTDRSAQLLLLLIFLNLFEIKFLKYDLKIKNSIINLMSLLIIFAASLKALYIIYLILIPFAFYSIKNVNFYIKNINYKFSFVLLSSLIMIFLINFLNTGCFLYPAKKTCSDKVIWHIPKEEVKLMNTHYEWWAKAGGGPNYKHELSKEEYIKNFNWVANWIDKYFFNKISDTLLGILAISLIYIFLFRRIRKKKFKKIENKNLFGILLILFIFIIEWFLKHPAMRYGGFVLISLPIFIFTSLHLSKYKYDTAKLIDLTKILVLVIFFIFISRNLIRLDKEINFYGYDILKSPFFYVKNIKSEITFQRDEFKIFSPTNGSCWSSKTPCSYNRSLEAKSKYGFNIINRKND